MINQPVRRGNRFANNICVVAECKNASSGEFWREECFQPRFFLAVGRPGTLPVTRKTVNKADIDRSVRTGAQIFDAIRKIGTWTGL